MLERFGVGLACPHGFQASHILKIWHCGSNFALVYAIVHEMPQLEICENWHNCPWQYFRSFYHRMVILFVFMALERVVLPASRNKSHPRSCWHDVFSGGPWPVILQTQAYMEMAKFVRSASKTFFINPWIQTALFLIIAIAATSAAVSWQFVGWISQIPFQLVISVSTDYIPPLWTKCGVYNAVKYFSRNK